MALATVAGVRAHRAAERAFRAGASEYEIHLAYCQAAGAREEELPYNNIIAFDRHAAVLHYQVLDRSRPPGVKSFLIDAGAQHAGYACDITRTYAADAGEFLDLIRSVDSVQQKLCDRVRPGVDYRDIHLEAHRSLAGVLVTHGIVTGSPEAAVESGLTSVFFPHGIGHLLGIMVHDASGFAAGPAGGTREKPEGHDVPAAHARPRAGVRGDDRAGNLLHRLAARGRARRRARARDRLEARGGAAALRRHPRRGQRRRAGRRAAKPHAGGVRGGGLRRSGGCVPRGPQRCRSRSRISASSTTSAGGGGAAAAGAGFFRRLIAFSAMKIAAAMIRKSTSAWMNLP